MLSQTPGLLKPFPMLPTRAITRLAFTSSVAVFFKSNAACGCWILRVRFKPWYIFRNEIVESFCRGRKRMGETRLCVLDAKYLFVDTVRIFSIFHPPRARTRGKYSASQGSSCSSRMKKYLLLCKNVAESRGQAGIRAWVADRERGPAIVVASGRMYSR